MWLSYNKWCCLQLVYSVVQQHWATSYFSSDWICNLSRHVNSALTAASCAMLFHCLLHPLSRSKQHKGVKRDIASEMLYRLQVCETRHDHPSLSALWLQDKSLTRGWYVWKAWFVWPPFAFSCGAAHATESAQEWYSRAITFWDTLTFSIFCVTSSGHWTHWHLQVEMLLALWQDGMLGVV